jgi:hypothetical protein
LYFPMMTGTAKRHFIEKTHAGLDGKARTGQRR